MICKNCGAQLAGMEHACPVCGFPLPDPSQQMVQPQPVQQYQAIPQPPQPQMMSAQPMQPMTGVTPGQEVQNAQPPKKDNKMFGILLALVAFAAIGVGVFLLLTDDEESTAPSNQGQEEVVPSTNSMTYGGYTFSIPADYSYDFSADDGIILKNGSTLMTIAVDYTNNYDYYKKAFSDAFPDQAANIVTKVGEKEYIAAILTDTTNNAFATQYITAAESGAFVGLLVRSDYTAPTTTEFAELNEILSTASKTALINPGDTEDIGKSGIKNYIPTFTKTRYPF